MSESPIYEGILEQARKDAEVILANARREADEVIQAARTRAEATAAEERKNTSTRLEGLRLREESAVRSLERQEELKNNDAAWNAVSESVSAYFEDYFRSAGSRRTLVLWIAEAAYGLGLAEAKVSWRQGEQVDEGMLEEASRLLKEKTGFSVRLTPDAQHHIPDWGVLLSSPDDKVYFNNQLGVRMRRMTKDIKKIIQESTCKAE